MDDADSTAATTDSADDCPICATPRRYFADGRKCPKCGSVERHRAFWLAFREHFGADSSMAGARVLALRGDRGDRAMLYGFGAAKVVSFDAFPRDAPEVVADPTAMDFEDASFDVVLSNGFLATVRDPGAVLAEMRRVLKPAGAALIYETTAIGKFTVEIEDRDRQIAWYGEEALDSYGVGQFREWGFKDLEALVGQSFGVGLFDTVEAPSGKRYVWFFGMQAPLAVAPFMEPAQRAALLGEDQETAETE